MNMFTKKLNWLIMSMMLMVSGSAWAGEVTDVITAADLAATSTNYTEFKNVSFVSDAIYAGQSAKTSSGGIQLRSKNSNSGIVSTTSGGKIKSVTITYESGDNTVDVYGSNTAYTSAADLYSKSDQGHKVGSLTETGTIDFSGADVDYAYIGIRSYNGALYLSSIEITWETDGGETVTVTAPSFSPAGGEYTEAQTVTITADDGCKIYYSIDGSEPTTEYEGALTISETTTLRAIAEDADGNKSTVTTATYTIVDPNAPGSANNPYTVAEALAFIETLGTTTSDEVYVSGIISQIDEVSTTHGNATYYISDDGTTESQLEVYRGKYLDDAAFTSQSQIAVGDEVTVYGKLKNYKGNTPEFDQGNYIVNLVHNGKVDIATINSLTPTEVDVETEGTFEVDVTLAEGLAEDEYEITFTSDNTDVLDVTTSGEYQAYTAGTVTITVHVEALDNDIYNNVDKVFTVTVTDPSTADQEVIDLTGATASISFSDFSKAGSSYTTGIQGAFPASDGKAYTGWVKKDCSYNSTNHEILQMKKNAGTLTSPTIKSDKGIKVIVTYGSSAGITLQIGESSITGKAGGNYENTSSSVELSSPATETTFIISAGSNAAYISSIEIVPLTDADLVETIKVGPAGYATYVTKNAVEFNGVKAYAVTAINEKSVSLQELTSAPAGTPVVVEAAEGEYPCTIVESADAPETNLLTYSEEAVESDGTFYALANKPEAEGVGFYPVKSGVTIPAGKAYLVVGAEVKGFLALGDVADAINNILVETANGNIFNIAGQKVQNITKGGLYIVNGKKVFVK